MEWLDTLVKTLSAWGPWAIGWGIAAFYMWKDYKNQRDEIDSRVRYAVALEALAHIINGNNGNHKEVT